MAERPDRIDRRSPPATLPERRQLRWQFATLALALVGILAATGWSLEETRRAAWDRAIQSSDNLVTLIEQNIGRDVDLYDLALLDVIDGLKLPGLWSVDPAMQRQILFDRSATAKHLGAILVLDEAGRAIASSVPLPPAGESFASAPYFTAQRDNPGTGLYIGAPAADPAGGGRSIALSRRWDHPDGSFAGIVVGTVSLDFFRDLFGSIDPGPDGAISIFRTDGTLIARSPAPASAQDVDDDPLSDAAIRHYAAGDHAGIFMDATPAGGVRRIHDYRQVGSLPLVVSVAQAQSAIFAEWRQKSIVVVLVVGLLAALAIALGALLHQELQRRGGAERTARDSERRFRLLADHSQDMIGRIDHEGRRLYVSPAARLLYGGDPAELIGGEIVQQFHPDDRGRLAEIIASLTQGI